MLFHCFFAYSISFSASAVSFLWTASKLNGTISASPTDGKLFIPLYLNFIYIPSRMPRNNQRNLSILVLCLCFFSQPLFAQNLMFVQLGIGQGLPASEVYNLFQDNQGYVWAFTEYGMVKHNGTRFTPACKNLPFDESIIYTVRRSPRGDMYVANSRSHIYLIKNDSAFMIRGIETASDKINSDNEVIYDMQINAPDDIFFSTFKSSYHYAGQNPVRLTSFADKGLSCFKKAGTGYVSLQKHRTTALLSYIHILDEKDRVMKNIPGKPIPEMGDRMRLVEDEHYFYIQTHETLIRLSKTSNEIRTAPVKEIMTLKLSPQGNIWLGTKKGLYELDTSLAPVGHYFKQCIISDILFDKHNGAWVSTIEQGVFYCSNTGHSFYDNIDELTGNISMLRKTADSLFIGTTDGKLLLMATGKITAVDIGSNAYAVKDICVFNGEYIVGAKGGLFVLDRKLKLIKQREFIALNGHVNGYGFIQHSPDSMVLITGASVTWVSTKNYTEIPGGFRIGANNRCIVKQGHNKYLIGTSKGLATFNDSLYFSSLHNILRGIVITRLKQDKKGNTWICTKGHGLYILYKDNRLEQFENTPSDVINDITFDEYNTFLLCTNTGLYHYSKPLKNEPVWKRVLEKDVSECVIYGSKIFAATQHGLIAINRQKLSVDFNPPFFLESVWAGTKNINPNEIRLAYNENDLYFNFEVLAYDNPGCSFQYRLEGPESIENISGTGQLHLQHLSPGQYTLSAYVLDNTQNISTNSPARIDFYIKPAFWQTRVFMILTITGGVALIILLMWQSYRRLKQKELRKTMIMRELAENRLTALKSQINPHFISNSLTAIQHLVINNKIDRANLYIARFSLLIRYALEYSDKILTSLSNEINIIEIVVSLEQLRFSDSFVFETYIDKDIDIHKLFVPPLITQPIIENAIWHGLLPLKGLRKPKLILKIEQSTQNLNISIIDNGVGRFSKTKRKAERESKGNQLINSWIDNLNKLFPENSAAIEVTDLSDEKNNPTGTRVDIVLNIKALNNLQHDKR
jgi:ligand-binding sensor domain-containing protein